MQQVDGGAPAAEPREDDVAALEDVFWRSALEASRLPEVPTRGPSKPSVTAAKALLRMAAVGAGGKLRGILRPDLEVLQVTYTVACYEMGSLTPAGLHAIDDPCEALAALVRCHEASHVASELICSGANGVQWVSMVRADRRIAFHLPSTATVTAPDPDEASAAVVRWRGALGRLEAEIDLTDRPAIGPRPVQRDPVSPEPVAPPAAERVETTPARPRERPPQTGPRHDADGRRRERAAAQPMSGASDPRAVTDESMHAAMRSAVAEVVPLLERYLLDAVAGAMTESTEVRIEADMLESISGMMTDQLVVQIRRELESTQKAQRQTLSELSALRREVSQLTERLRSVDRGLFG